MKAVKVEDQHNKKKQTKDLGILKCCCLIKIPIKKDNNVFSLFSKSVYLWLAK